MLLVCLAQGRCCDGGSDMGIIVIPVMARGCRDGGRYPGRLRVNGPAGTASV